ncbi:MAG: diacylglyceryl transferase [Methylotenera sp.]|nr:diacylglyceryl transferase [Methylotenera sp.]
MIHLIFEYLALFAGVQYYRRIQLQTNGQGLLSGQSFWLVLGCIFGAAIGNKALFWLENPTLFAMNLTTLLHSGQSMVGGLLGGLIGVEVAKRFNGITQRTGDDFVYPILLGLLIGRIGCFLAGLPDGTHGNPTNLPWGYDFGDGIPRHATQLYEIIFTILLWIGFYLTQQRLNQVKGLRFRIFLCAYLLWRLLIDSIKPVPFAYFGVLSGIQLVCVIALLCYLPSTIEAFRKKNL